MEDTIAANTPPVHSISHQKIKRTMAISTIQWEIMGKSNRVNLVQALVVDGVRCTEPALVPLEVVARLHGLAIQCYIMYIDFPLLKTLAPIFNKN